MDGIEFKRNPETGVLEAFKDGKYIGEVTTMGDSNEPDK